METLAFDLDNYTVTVQLPRGADVDDVAVLSRVAELNTLNEPEIVAALTALGCVAVNVSSR